MPDDTPMLEAVRELTRQVGAWRTDQAERIKGTEDGLASLRERHDDLRKDVESDLEKHEKRFERIEGAAIILTTEVTTIKLSMAKLIGIAMGIATVSGVAGGGTALLVRAGEATAHAAPAHAEAPAETP